MILHRNSPKRFYIQGAAYFITTKTWGNIPHFKNLELADLCVNKLQITKMIATFFLYAYVVMPDHVHLLIEPTGRSTISTVMHCFKRNVSRSINCMFAVPVGEDDHPHLQNKFQWQSSYYDHVIRDQWDFECHFHYIHNNPIKAGYVTDPEDWPWSSYRKFIKETDNLIDPIPG